MPKHNIKTKYGFLYLVLSVIRNTYKILSVILPPIRITVVKKNTTTKKNNIHAIAIDFNL